MLAILNEHIHSTDDKYEWLGTGLHARIKLMYVLRINKLYTRSTKNGEKNRKQKNTLWLQTQMLVGLIYLKNNYLNV